VDRFTYYAKSFSVWAQSIFNLKMKIEETPSPRVFVILNLVFEGTISRIQAQDAEVWSRPFVKRNGVLYDVHRNEDLCKIAGGYWQTAEEWR
jgi:hypothetical protein